MDTSRTDQFAGHHRRSSAPWRTIAAVAAAALGIIAAGTASADDKLLKKVTLVVEWIGYQPQHFGFWIAKDRGWYGEEGLDVSIKGSGGSGQVIQIMSGRGAEFSNVATTTLAQAMGKTRVPLKVVALWGQKDLLSVAYFESTGIKNVKDFEGRRMGIVPGSMAHLIWPAFTKATGIDAAKVDLLHWDFRSYYGIWAAKKVDISGNMALGTTAPDYFERKMGETVKQVVFSDYVPLMGPGVMVHDDTIAKDPAMVRAFVKATQRAWEYMRDKPDEAVLEAANIVSKNYDKIDPVPALASYAKEVVPGYMVSDSTKGQPIGWMNPDDWQKMIDLLAANDKQMTSRPAVSDLMTNKFVQ